ncbi:MAG: hypothetical protein ABI573_06960 [Chloroflexota bacterium]
MNTEALVNDYLDRLAVAARGLVPERRSELIDEVREHITASMAERGTRDESDVRNVLERLGRPEDIVAAEDGAQPVPSSGAQPQAAPPAADTGWGGLEVAAVLLLTLGSALLFVGPTIGLVLVWLSNRWTTREKTIATLIVLALFVLPFAVGLAAAEVGRAV